MTTNAGSHATSGCIATTESLSAKASLKATNNFRVGGIYYTRNGSYENIGSLYAGLNGKWWSLLLSKEPAVMQTFYCVPRMWTPYIDGDIMLSTEIRKVNPETGRLVKVSIKVGHVHTQQSEDGKRTWYFGRFTQLLNDMVGKYLRVKE